MARLPTRPALARETATLVLVRIQVPQQRRRAHFALRASAHRPFVRAGRPGRHRGRAHEAAGGRCPGQALCGYSSMAERHLAMVEARVRFPVAAPRPSSPTWQRRTPQEREVRGSNPRRGTKESEPDRAPGVAAIHRAPAEVWRSCLPLSSMDGWRTGKAPRWKRAVGARVLSRFNSCAIRRS